MYATRSEAIQREIIDPIEAGDASADQFDIDMIADQVLGDWADGFPCHVDTDEFWLIVSKNAHPELPL